MRVPHLPQVCSALACATTLFFCGCNNPSTQTLASMTVTATPTSLTVGGKSTLHAVAHLSDGTTQDVTGATQWTLSNSALATVTDSTLSARAAGSLGVSASYIEATPAGNSPASATTVPQTLNASTQITIAAAPGPEPPTPAPPTTSAITWAPPAAITYGTPLGGAQLDATANLPGAFTYTPAAGAVLTAGTQTLSVTFAPSDGEPSVTSTVSLTINPAAPAVTWPQPAAIVAGTALSAAQLDATASVPGSFVYSPAAGATPAAGTQTLTATFAPADATDYTVVKSQATLLVNAPSTGGPPPPTPGPVAPPNRPTLTGCGGPTVNVNSSMSQSTLQSAIQSAPHCAFVLFAPGTYTITSPIHVPCSVSLGGPPVAWAQGDVYTAKIVSAVSSRNYPLNFPSCTATTSIQYLSCYGGRPSPDGGGCIYIASGVSNLTVTENYLYGNQGNAAGGSLGDSLLYFDGSSSATVDNNDTVTWNQLGQQGDCSNLMSNNSYSGLSGDGGYCNGLGIHQGMSNLVANDNIYSYLEQGMKVFEGQGQCVNCYIQYNDFHHIHRINFETQANIGGNQPTLMYIQYNSIHDQYDTNYGAWGFSAANGCNSGCVTHTDDNVLINNTQATNGGQYTPGAVEIWGSNGTTDNYNLIQGYWANGLDSSSTGQFVENDNTFCMAAGGSTAPPGKGGYFNNENENPQQYTPTAAGNTFSNSPTCAQTSVAPVISPASGSFSGSQTVTFTTAGTNRDANTGIWYTTDGSTPVPGSGTAQYVQSGGSVTVSSNTIKAVGMWGAQNQPASYPAGYGYVPSSVVTASYTPATTRTNGRAGSSAAPASGSSPEAAVLQSLLVEPSAPVVNIGETVQLKAMAAFSDGTTRDVSGEVAWLPVSSPANSRSLTLAASGQVSGVATGQALIIATYQGRQTAVLAISQVGELVWSTPITITHGGTYAGNWRSNDASTPAVTVATTESVTLENTHLQGPGNLIEVQTRGADLTVRNSVGTGVTPDRRGQSNGAFVDAGSPARLDVEGNYMENLSNGVVVRGFSGRQDAQETIVVRRNRARNLIGLLSDGVGGRLPYQTMQRRNGHFLELENATGVAGIEVAWNEVIHDSTRSLVSEVVGIYRSGGTPNQPLEIHDSYIEGSGSAAAGSGIATVGEADDTIQKSSSFAFIHDNQVVGATSRAIAFAAGHDNVAANNRVIASGMLDDGTKLMDQRVGLSAANPHGNPAFFNNSMHDNVVGWACWNAFCAAERFPTSPGDYASNTVADGQQVTLETEQREYSLWQQKVFAAGVQVGPSF